MTLLRLGRRLLFGLSSVLNFTVRLRSRTRGESRDPGTMATVGGDELTNRSQYREYLPLSLYYILRTYEVPGCDTSYFSSVPVG